MTTSMDPAHWLEVLRREYLDGFVAEGGTSVKFAVPLDDEARAVLWDGAGTTATESGYVVATVDAATSRIHLVDQLFVEVARVVPWRRLAREVLAGFARDVGYTVPDAALEPAGEPSAWTPERPLPVGWHPPVSEPFAVGVARANDLDPAFVHTVLQPPISRAVFGMPGMAREMRVAMSHLCLAELGGGADGAATTLAVTDWLTGRNRALSAIKPYHIHTRITRANARHLLESLLAWVRAAGRPGTVVLLDISRLAVPRNPRDSGFFYSRAALLDAYELLRQCVDATDRLHGCLVLVLCDPDFLDEDTRGRGMGAYSALRLRVLDEVRDARLANPMASLIRPATCAPVGQGGVRS